MHRKEIKTAGKPLGEAKKVLIMVHGRGGSSEDILSLSQYLDLKDIALLAPQATNNSWYPYSFISPPEQNEPWLSSALDLIKTIVEDLQDQGISPEHIYFLGFSQGACLTLEFVTRNAKKYGGVIAFTGGLIGDKIIKENYKGDFGQTLIFIGSSDPDPHVPVERVNETAKILENMNALVVKKIYPGMGHTINADEIAEARRVLGI